MNKASINHGKMAVLNHSFKTSALHMIEQCPHVRINNTNFAAVRELMLVEQFQSFS